MKSIQPCWFDERTLLIRLFWKTELFGGAFFDAC